MNIKRILLVFLLLLLPAACVCAQEGPIETDVPMTLSSPSVILIEPTTGTVIFEKNADERRPVASVTKVMTILLTLEAIDEGRIAPEDEVTVSEHAQSMGGSQVFLDAGGRYKISELLKSVIIASANDSAVALAEALCGSEEAFVRRMNERAAQLGLENTNYVNCSGLPAQGHYMSARDVAVLSAELDKHSLYYAYSTIWMDEIAHAKGRVTQMTNTNRLVRFYPGCDGYKTGSTNEARYCMAATAKKEGMRLIAVVLGAPAGQTRFNEARAMLEYGFANYMLFSPVREGDALGLNVSVRMGGADEVSAVCGGNYALLLPKGAQGEIALNAALIESIAAPVKKGDALGEIQVMRSGEVIATVPAVAGEAVELPGFLHGLLRIRNRFILGR